MTENQKDRLARITLWIFGVAFAMTGVGIPIMVLAWAVARAVVYPKERRV